MMPRTRRPINWTLLVASFVISVLLWMFVGAQTSQFRTISVDVRSQGADSDRYFVRKIPESVSATLRGTQSQLSAVSPQSVQAYVDLSSAKSGRNEYPIRIFPEQVQQLLSEFPRTVMVDIEPIIQRDLPVTVESSGELMDTNFVLDTISPKPGRVLVKGPKSEVDQIEKVRAVLPLGQVEMDRLAPYPVDVVALTRDNRPMQYVRCIPLQINVNASLVVASVEKEAFVNAKLIGAPATGFQVLDYEMDPARVAVSGSATLLAKLTSLETEPVDISGLSGTTTVEVAVTAPVGVRLRRRTVKVTVRIEPKSLPGSVVVPTVKSPPPKTQGPSAP